MIKLFKIEVYVPETHCEMLKTAMFDAGAGKLDNYDCCAWQSFAGTGQFRPLNGSSPFLGETGKIERVKEIKIELICEKKFLRDVIKTIHKFHPYEMPALQYWEVGTGRIGE